MDINRQEYPPGTIVYYTERDGCMYKVGFGAVEENYPSSIAIQLYEPVDRRLIDGIPVKELPYVSEWRKLPKGWTYNTELFKLTFAELPSDIDTEKCEYTTENIRRFIDAGILVPVHENDDCRIETEIDKNHGWRLVKKYPLHTGYHPDWISLYPHEVYATPEEAYKAAKEMNNELKIQAEMSDYDWSVSLIDRDLDRWANIYAISETDKKAAREFILSQKNVEDIETRLSNGGIQWKYCKNKRWMNVNYGG